MEGGHEFHGGLAAPDAYQTIGSALIHPHRNGKALNGYFQIIVICSNIVLILLRGHLKEIPHIGESHEELFGSFGHLAVLAVIVRCHKIYYFCNLANIGKMHKIFFEKRCIIICNPDDQALSDPNAIAFHIGDKIDVGTLVSMFEYSKSLSRIYIPTSDTDDAYKRLCAEFKEVNAAGGLVSNRRSDYLLISRNGLWDLPKGHQEEGEDIEVTALREVQEETGVDKLELGELICITDHCYIRDGIWHLKHTWWYSMLYNAPTDLTPQKEEDISRAAWVAKSSLPPFLKNTYPSIVEVFKEAKI